MKSRNSIVTISGVHGVGKSAVISYLCEKLRLSAGTERPKNPFAEPYEAMLFFVASFGQRDREACACEDPLVLDRWSAVDVSIYIEALDRLGRLQSRQADALQAALNASASARLVPTLAVLLDDAPEEILSRLKRFRAPSKHHLFERDLEFITELRRRFVERFDAKEWPPAQPPGQSSVVKIGKRSPGAVADEVVSLVRAAT